MLRQPAFLACEGVCSAAHPCLDCSKYPVQVSFSPGPASPTMFNRSRSVARLKPQKPKPLRRGLHGCICCHLPFNRMRHCWKSLEGARVLFDNRYSSPSLREDSVGLGSSGFKTGFVWLGSWTQD